MGVQRYPGRPVVQVTLNWVDACELPPKSDPERWVSVFVKMWVLDSEGQPYMVEGHYNHHDQQWVEESDTHDCYFDWDADRVLKWALAPVIQYNEPA